MALKGIYLITNNSNGKRYVGASINIHRRFSEHRCKYNIRTKTTVLTRAFRKYSVLNFSFQILEIVPLVSGLPLAEQRWIKKLGPEYNMNKGGKGNLGRVVSDEIKSILKVAGKLQWASKTNEEKKAFIKNNLTGPTVGHKVSKETREKLRARNLGKKQSQSTIIKRAKKLSVIMKGNTSGNKAVLKLKNGKIISRYLSAKDAAKENKIHPSSITHALKGDQKTAAGFEWKYL